MLWVLEQLNDVFVLPLHHHLVALKPIAFVLLIKIVYKLTNTMVNKTQVF